MTGCHQHTIQHKGGDTRHCAFEHGRIQVSNQVYFSSHHRLKVSGSAPIDPRLGSEIILVSHTEALRGVQLLLAKALSVS